MKYVKPAPEQLEDAKKMATMGDLPNFSGAGTGKTVTALEAIREAKHQRGLILGPVVSLDMWKQSVEAQLGATAGIMKSASGVIPNTDFVIASYGLMSRRDIAVSRLKKEFKDTAALILDESHNVRRADSKRAEAVYGRNMSGEDSLIEHFAQVWPMSGNPIFRYADDLWPMLRALYPDILHRYKALSYSSFVSNFCRVKKAQYHPLMKPKWEVCGNTNEYALNRILYEQIGAIRRKDVAGLPELRIRELNVPIKSGSIKYAAEIKRMSFDDIVKLLSAGDAMLMQVSMALALAKLETSADYIIESAMKAPVLLGVWHSTVGKEAHARCVKAGLRAERVYGAVSHEKRDAIKDAFNNGDIDIIIGQEAAMGTSWNLQEACRHVMILEDNVSPGVIEQFYKRVYRRGQQNPCLVDFLKTEHPVEQAITMIRERKDTGTKLILD